MNKSIRSSIIFLFPFTLLIQCFNKVEIVPFPGLTEQPLQETTLFSDEKDTGCFSTRAAEKILLIPIHGPISSDTTRPGRGISPGTVFRMLETAKQDTSIKAIVLHIESPGGTVSASDELYQMLRRFSQEHEIPVFAHINGIGASGAYYVAMAAQEINAAPTAMTGSIGVIIRSFHIPELLDKLGVEYNTIQSSEFKDLLSPFRSANPEEAATLEHQVQESYERFLSVILESRQDLTEDNLRNLADGRVYSSDRSQQAGLTDSTDYVESYLRTLQERLSLSSLHVISYIPGGSSHANLYDPTGSGPMNLQELMQYMAQNARSGLYYLWDAGL